MRSTATLALLAAVPASAITLDWGRALANIPEEMRHNASIASTGAASGKIAYCNKAGSHASNFVATIVPVGPTSGASVDTTFDYVRARCRGCPGLCWGREFCLPPFAEFAPSRV